MKYIITDNQYNLLKEYFDPIYFMKKKFSNDKSVKPPENVKYEADFQKYANLIFKYTNKSNPLKHLKGVEILKVTPSTEWTVLMKPVIDDWFNYCENSEYKGNLKSFEDEFKKNAEWTHMGSPFSEEGLPQNVRYVFWNECSL